MKVWVDPPSGWKYGFPAIWDDEKETMDELFARMNYPEDYRDSWVRMWEPTKEELNES